jgi:hypothetical protein
MTKTKRSDVVDGVSYGDWYEQTLKENGYESETRYYNGHEEAPELPPEPKPRGVQQ